MDVNIVIMIALAVVGVILACIINKDNPGYRLGMIVAIIVGCVAGLLLYYYISFFHSAKSVLLVAGGAVIVLILVYIVTVALQHHAKAGKKRREEQRIAKERQRLAALEEKQREEAYAQLQAQMKEAEEMALQHELAEKEDEEFMTAFLAEEDEIAGIEIETQPEEPENLPSDLEDGGLFGEEQIAREETVWEEEEAVYTEAGNVPGFLPGDGWGEDEESITDEAPVAEEAEEERQQEECAEDAEEDEALDEGIAMEPDEPKQDMEGPVEEPNVTAEPLIGEAAIGETEEMAADEAAENVALTVEEAVPAEEDALVGADEEETDQAAGDDVVQIASRAAAKLKEEPETPFDRKKEDIEELRALIKVGFYEEALKKVFKILNAGYLMTPQEKQQMRLVLMTLKEKMK